jgi:hypothetical protein
MAHREELRELGETEEGGLLQDVDGKIYQAKVLF